MRDKFEVRAVIVLKLLDFNAPTARLTDSLRIQTIVWLYVHSIQTVV